MFKKIKLFVTLILTAVLMFSAFSFQADAAKKGKSKGLKPEEIQQIKDDISTLTRKVYAQSLFSPEENEKLIGIKMQLDTAMISGPNPEFAPLYYLAGNLYRAREYKDDAIECYQAVLENFGDTAFAPKARAELLKLGIKVESANFPSDGSQPAK